MKAVLGWVSDPYVHVFLVGLLLVRLATGTGGGEPGEPVDRLANCTACRTAHDAAQPCPQITARINSVLHRQ